jgi:RNA polymerase sigma-70 factor (ECF subfamily)
VAVHDDPQLVADAAGGSRAAGEELFGRHWPWAWRLAYSITRSTTAADDVAQDAFERAFRSLAAFNGRSTFRTWLSRIVVNQAIDFTRRQRRHGPVDPDDAAVEPTAEDAVEGRAVVDAVLALSMERRTVVALRYWGGHDPPEIADILGLPLGTVHSRLARALAELRTRMEETDDART